MAITVESGASFHDRLGGFNSTFTSALVIIGYFATGAKAKRPRMFRCTSSCRPW